MSKKSSILLKQCSFIVILITVLGIGIYLIVASHAATPYSSSEAEVGTLSGTVTIQTDSTASVGKYVEFGSVSLLNSSYGYFSDLQYETSTQIASTLQTWKNAGALYVRFQLEWSLIQPTDASDYDWSTMDNVISDILADGMIPLPVAGDTPSWADPSTCTTSPTCAPATQYESAFGTFMQTAAARYAGRVNDWEIWNEANSPNFWQPAPNPVEYTALLKAAYAGIHHAEPNATVISSGLAPGTDTEGGGWISPVTFLTDIYNDGGQGSFDAVGWHPYTWPSDPSTQYSGLSWYQMVNNARALMTANNDGSKKIWATEFGAPTCTGDTSCESQTSQASAIQSGITMWKSYSWAGPLIIYTYQDTCNDETDPECFFGVTTANGTPKPALSVLEKNY